MVSKRFLLVLHQLIRLKFVKHQSHSQLRMYGRKGQSTYLTGIRMFQTRPGPILSQWMWRPHVFLLYLSLHKLPNLYGSLFVMISPPGRVKYEKPETHIVVCLVNMFWFWLSRHDWQTCPWCNSGRANKSVSHWLDTNRHPRGWMLLLTGVFPNLPVASS